VNILRHNRRLRWTAVAAAAWAMLGIAASLAHADGSPPFPEGRPGGPGPQFGLHLRLPPGSVALPGRLVEVREEPGLLHITLAVPEGQARTLLGAQGEPLTNLPEGVQLEFLTPQAAAGRELTISTLQGGDHPLRLPGGREVIVGERYFVGLGPRGAALIPHEGHGLRLLHEHRGLWGEPPSPATGPRPGQAGPEGGPDRPERRGRPRERLREWWQERRQPGG
jgi:hypothetical protein